MQKKEYTTIDIGAKNIKIIQGKFYNNTLSLSNLAIIPTPENSFRDGTFFNQDAIIDEINKARKNNGIKNNELIIVVSGSSIITREVLFPKMNEKDVSKVLKFEIEQYFPVDLSKYIVDYKYLGEVQTKEGSKMKLLIVAVPEYNAEAYMNIAKRCNFNVNVVDINQNALSKFAVQILGKENTQESVAIIDLGARSTTIVLTHDSILQFGREIAIGSDEITSLIAKYLSLSYEEAEEYKIAKSELFLDSNIKSDSMNEEDALIYKDVNKKFSEVASEINKIIEYYNSKNPQAETNKIFLTGNGARLTGIDKFLEKSLNIEVKLLDDFTKFNIQSKLDVKEKIYCLSNAIGALIR